jgi:osmotically-inducible protein OsmY
MKLSASYKLTGVSLLLLAGLAACDKPGPAENAGKNIDRSMTQAGNAINDSADKVAVTMAEQSDKAGVAIDDTEITTKIKAAIFAEAGLRTLQISVDTVKGVVTLSGSANSQANSDMAKALAGAVKGVKEVKNNLVVKPVK